MRDIFTGTTSKFYFLLLFEQNGLVQTKRPRNGSRNGNSAIIARFQVVIIVEIVGIL